MNNGPPCHPAQDDEQTDQAAANDEAAQDVCEQIAIERDLQRYRARVENRVHVDPVTERTLRELLEKP